MSAEKVLYVIAQLGSGGTESQVLHLVRRLDRARFEPQIVTFTPGGALEESFAKECPIHVLPKRAATEIQVLAGLRSLIRRLRPSILHTCLYPANWRGALAARLAGRPVVIGSVRNLSTWMRPVHRMIERAATRAADAVIVNADAVGRFMIDVVGVRADRLRRIPNGVDTDVYHARRESELDLRPSLLGEGGSVLAGAVMSLTAKKNPEVLLEAAAKVIAARPDARFVVAGDGPLREQIAARAQSGPSRGRFGLLGLREDVPDLLRAFDLLVLPSDREGLPNVVLEAMATGIPVVATNVGGVGELVRDGVTGRLVLAGDADALAGAILDVIQDPLRARAMGQEGARIAREEYEMSRMVERTMSLYEELLLARSRARLGTSEETPGRAPGAVR